MARPEKCKRICNLPENNFFYCKSDREDKDIQIMSIEEYETVRLIDYVGMTQEQCAEQMHVARTTVQRMYTDARKKIAAYLVLGSSLEVCGGNYISENNETCCQKFSCANRTCGCSCDFRTRGCRQQ